MNQPRADIPALLRAKFRAPFPAKIGIALSGGGDSMALLRGMAAAFPDGECELMAVTVDHGLRREAAEEAQFAGSVCATLGIAHTILHWSGWDGRGNLQDQARRARYRLIAEWARAASCVLVALGHTADDQAETVLMRLSRQSGVDGLSGIPARRVAHGVNFIRPLLDRNRAELREYLSSLGAEWIEDPSNDDDAFERIKARRALEALAPLGIGVAELAQVADNMRRAREALDWFSFLSARDIACVSGGDVVLDLRRFRTLPEEIQRRLLIRALNWIGGETYVPRRSALADLIAAISQGRAMTLSGCHVLRRRGAIWICREYRAVAGLRAAPTALWDRRWILRGPSAPPGAYVAALGAAGLRQLGGVRGTDRPQASLLASPALWLGDAVIAAPLVQPGSEWTAEIAGGGEEFFAALLSH